MHNKTVYILGAGFSKSAGAPLQSGIIKDIFSLTRDQLQEESYCELFFNYLAEFRTVLSEIFFIGENEFKNFSLEDIYSIIDRCLLDNLSLRGYRKVNLIELRNKINALIIMLMNYRLKHPHPLVYVKKFSSYLVNKRKESFENDKDGDPFTIISTNWDIVIENGLQSEIQLYHYASSHGNPTTRGFIDYCFYVHAYDEYDYGKKLRSGLYWRGKGFYNLKVLKLHGSMNWLQCQRCQRVFITFFQKIALEQFVSKPTCNYCGGKGAELLNVLIMPTFLKDLNILQLKLSWQIAGIELQEASKIIFMGYSFPMADFEFRQLLARSVRTDAEIDVVLWKTDNPKNFPEDHPIQETLPEFRYKPFFGRRKINFFYDGVEEYINEFYN